MSILEESTGDFVFILYNFPYFDIFFQLTKKKQQMNADFGIKDLGVDPALASFAETASYLFFKTVSLSFLC